MHTVFSVELWSFFVEEKVDSLAHDCVFVFLSSSAQRHIKPFISIVIFSTENVTTRDGVLDFLPD